MMLKKLLFFYFKRKRSLSLSLRYKKQLKTIISDKHMVTKIIELVRKETYTTTTGYNKQSRLRRVK